MRQQMPEATSPGASTAAYIALHVLERCFASQLHHDGWLNKLKTIIPTFGTDLRQDVQACLDIRPKTASVLNLEYV